ncbi:hypothetical protein [Corynebacterium heidelbergense]|uniref:hypothetical protein n=1 Tax=Corynebacterium heidelbergense TaxID=2055947 RepID=UPI0015EE5126|nr:hypothetical protein [Corynebacterium heidelbergense]WCZ35752.1 hypothetical protein CHEID_00865 [Corynebacterium heidelbergense]
MPFQPRSIPRRYTRPAIKAGLAGAVFGALVAAGIGAVGSLSSLPSAQEVANSRSSIEEGGHGTAGQDADRTDGREGAGGETPGRN